MAGGEKEKEGVAVEPGCVAGGLPGDEPPAACPTRNKNGGGRTFSLPPETFNKAPRMDRPGLLTLRRAVIEKKGVLMFTFFNLAFPVDVVDLVCGKVRRGFGAPWSR